MRQMSVYNIRLSLNYLQSLTAFLHSAKLAITDFAKNGCKDVKLIDRI